MAQNQNDDRARTERMFKNRQQQNADAPKATADYYAARQKLRDRTREQLRLAREAEKKRGAAS
jgi:hypothetical protein